MLSVAGEVKTGLQFEVQKLSTLVQRQGWQSTLHGVSTSGRRQPAVCVPQGLEVGVGWLAL